MQLDQQAVWFIYLDHWQQDLVSTSFFLLNHFADEPQLKDFSFIIFPMAKAYEGFLKKMLLDLELITPHTYNSRRFRIGRALNPDVALNQRDAWWLYDNVEQHLGSDVARQMWQAWLDCRNHIFHFFPDGKQQVTWSEASDRLEQMQNIINQVAQYIKQRRSEE